jgi:hypothetical protein
LAKFEEIERTPVPNNTNQQHSKPQQPQRENGRKPEPKRTGFYVAVGVILLVAYAIVDHWYFTPKIAYVDTSKLMVGFSEAAEVERELNAEDAKWWEQLKELEDSLRASIDRMSKEYDKPGAYCMEALRWTAEASLISREELVAG